MQTFSFLSSNNQDWKQGTKDLGLNLENRGLENNLEVGSKEIECQGTPDNRRVLLKGFREEQETCPFGNSNKVVGTLF